jgi:hypothetical protein
MRFYPLLGFELIDQMGESDRLGWARMHCEDGALMFLRAEEIHPPTTVRNVHARPTNFPGASAGVRR